MPTPQLPKALILEGYKCFHHAERLDLRPLTLLYGRNNAGKSAVLRALATIGRSVSENAASPWDMGDAEGPGKEGSFADLPWRGRDLRYFSVAFEWPSAEPCVDQLLIERTDDDEIAVRAVLVGAAAQISNQRLRQLSTDSSSFVGLIPQHTTPSDERHPLAQRLGRLRGQVQWLQGGRVSPPRFIPLKLDPPVLKSNGADAGHKLLARWAQIGADVQAFYDQLGRKLQPGMAFSHYKTFFLDAAGFIEWQIQLADVGEGMSTVLPVLVAVASAVRGCGPSLVLIEDPEAHLHDDAVRLLAEWIAERLKENPKVRVVMETHSEILKLAVQNIVYEGTLPPEAVNLVWAEAQGDGHSKLKPVPLSQGGQPENNTLRGAFSEGLRLASSLAGFDSK